MVTINNMDRAHRDDCYLIGNTLKANQTLYDGQFLLSSNGCFRFQVGFFFIKKHLFLFRKIPLQFKNDSFFIKENKTFKYFRFATYFQIGKGDYLNVRLKSIFVQ